MAAPHIRLDMTDVALSRGERPLLSGLTLSVKSGEALWLTGPNGTGKTTILLAASGLLPPDSGTITWSRSEDRITPQSALSYAAHNGPEQDGLTLGEDLAFWQSVYGDGTETTARLDQVGLSGLKATPVAGLSAGQRRRLSLARLLSSKRPAWLMDEPLSGLDDGGRALTLNLIGDHLSRGGLAIIASHQPVTIPDHPTRKLVLDAA